MNNKQEGFYITSKGQKVRIKPYPIISISGHDVVYAKFPEKSIFIYCHSNPNLKGLDIPFRCHIVYCDDIKLNIKNPNTNINVTY